MRARVLTKFLLAATSLLSATAQAEISASSREILNSARENFQAGRYFHAARIAFSATDDAGAEAEAYSWVTLGLSRAGLYQSGAYFFIRTLQSGDRTAIRRVLTEGEEMVLNVGGDLFRQYILRHTTRDDYDAQTRNVLYYAMGKDALFKQNESEAIGFLSQIQRGSPLYPIALQLRATAYALTGSAANALRDFTECVDRAEVLSGRAGVGTDEVLRLSNRQNREVADDLKTRCQAGVARMHYEMGKFEAADQAYEAIPKASWVWPDILFEQAWNYYAQKDYNRGLGKLLSYQSPLLSFVFNPEVDVLTAQTYLAVCYYADANDILNGFQARYAPVGVEVKRFVEANTSNLLAFYEKGKRALADKLHTKNDFHRMLNRFVRGPYFQNMVLAEKSIAAERLAIRRFTASSPEGLSRGARGGFPGFLNVVLGWRKRTIGLLGGTFVKNSLIDAHSNLITAFENASFIKLEMLSQAKDRLLQRPGKKAGRVPIPDPKAWQQYWGFNGEFWLDELGDTIYGLESACGK